jgi:hypothetical protein
MSDTLLKLSLAVVFIKRLTTLCGIVAEKLLRFFCIGYFINRRSNKNNFSKQFS